MILPFGKHKGKDIREVPLSYQNWLMGQDWFTKKYAHLLPDTEFEFSIVRNKTVEEKEKDKGTIREFENTVQVTSRPYIISAKTLDEACSKAEKVQLDNGRFLEVR